MTLADQICMHIDRSLRTVFAEPPTSGREHPAKGIQENHQLSDGERSQSAELMRVNHAGEVSAQGLYQGQALFARDAKVREQMQQSAIEENDHLNWCAERLKALDSHTSHLSPLWYWGSFAIGAAAAAAGDKWSLGFVNETEKQVCLHIEEHLEKIPEKDARSRAILEQMHIDEGHHADKAVTAGAAELPKPIRDGLMPLISKVMKTAAAKI